MITIPSSELQPSLNLSQAVLIIAYELSKCWQAMARGRVVPKKRYDNSVLMDDLRAQEEIRPLYDKIAGVLELLDYVHRGDRDLMKKILTNIKHFIGRAGLTEWELNMLQGLCHQIEKRVPKR